MNQYFKLQARLLGIVAMTFFIGCQQTDKSKLGVQATEAGLSQDKLAIELNKSPTVKGLNLEGIKTPPLPDNYQEVVEKYQVITGGKVRQIIDTISEVLVNILDPETKREMPIPACFANWNNEEVMFVPALLLEESALLIQDYYNERPDSDKVQIISVENLADWLQLLQKAGPGMAAPPKTSVNARQTYILKTDYEQPTGNRSIYSDTDGGINKFFDGRDYADPSEYEYYEEIRKERRFFRTHYKRYTKRRLKNYYKWIRLCRREWMHNAVDIIPRQDDIAWGKDWSCGPTSAAKAIRMFGYDMSRNYYINPFLEKAPNRHNVQITTGQNVAVGGYVVAGIGILLAPFTGGVSAIVGHGAGMGMMVGGGIAIANAPSPGGVPIRNLVRYITDYLPGNRRAIYNSYDDWAECAKAIRDDIQQGDPVIITQIFTATHGHYLNVVGVKVDSSNTPVAFMLMEVDNHLREISYEDMEYLMERKYRSWVESLSSRNYHMIRFYR